MTMQPSNLKRAASYARSAETSPLTIEQQHQQNVARAACDGFEILPEHCYSDDGVSGVAMSRPGFDRLLNLISEETGMIERVYMRDPSRLGRWSDPRQVFYWDALIRSHGVQVCYSEGSPALYR